MTRKKSNVKALALAVTCAILAGGGIGLEPVYAADATLNVTNGSITAGSVSGTINGKVGSTDITDGTITGGSLSGGTFTGTVTLTGDNIKTAIDGVDISNAKVSVGTNSFTIGNLATNTQKISYAAATGTTVDGVVLNNKGISAADGNFTVNGTNAETVVKGDNGKTTITGGSVSIYNADSSQAVFINEGSVLAGNAVKAKVISAGLDIRMENGNVVAKNGLYIGYTSTNVTQATYDNSKFAVKGEDGSFKAANGAFSVDKDGKVATTSDIEGKDITATGALKGDSLDVNGNATVGGELTVNGAATFTKETAFANGIKTDKISEKNDGQGVTVDGVLLKDNGITAAGGNFTVDGTSGDTTVGGNLQANKNALVKGTLTVDGNIEGKGALKGKTLGIGTNGSEFTVDENGAVKAAGGKVEIDKDGNAQFGAVANNRTTIAGKLATFGENTTTDYTTINGGELDTYNLTVRNDMTVKNFKADNITSKNRITVGEAANEVYLGANGTLSLGTEANQKLVKTQLANINDTIKSGKVIEANSATIGGVEIKGGNVTTATGTITGKTITDGNGFTVNGGKITAKEGQIGNVVISAAGEVSGVTSLNVNGEIKANTFKVDGNNFLDGNGITAKGGTIGGAVIDGTTLTVGGTKLDSTEGITTNKLKIGGMTLTDDKLDTGTATFEVNGVEFKQGQVTAMADKGFVAGTSSFKQGSLIVDDNNKLEATNGLTTQKATVNGTLDVTGKATFGTANKQTTIEGDAITTDTLKANKLILGASGDTTVEVNKDGSLKAAGGKFAVDKDGALKAADGAFTVYKDGKTTFTKDADNLSSINGGNIWAKATDIADNTSSELTHDYKGLHIKGNKSGQKSAFDFDTASGIGTFTGQDNSTTKINGSAIRSEKIDGTAGKLNGENLTLYKDPNNQTTMSAGKATFTGDAGEKGGKVTTINGGTISTDTLNVERINLGEDILDSNGNPHGSNLSMDKQGNFSAAGGNFKVTGGSGADKGAFTNTVGKTTLQTDNAGASMKFDNTAAVGGVTSEVAVEANKATVAAGDNASFVANADNGGSATLTGGTQTVTTTDKGTEFKNSDHKDPFVKDGATTTIINGNEITTGKITTDELVITGKGDAAGPGTGSLAFGGNGTIKSDVKEDGSTNNTQFTTDINGVNTKVTNGTITTENNVSAAGNSNTVTKDDTHKSEFNQGLTSIGGVVTNGEIKVAQNLDGETGLLTNEVTDANGSSKLEQSGTGLTYTDSAKPDNATRIDSSDVSIGSATNEKDRINLSDLGQIDNLDTELTARDEYKNNQTAVGGINAEAAIRREEVARLDGRINDVNDRVNKVGAMAAAIASLKSIGYDPQAPSEFSIGLGQYKGETGVAMGFFHYPNKNFMINVSLSTAGGETMGGIGATWRFGHKSPQKLLEEQREEQAKKELAAAEKYQAAAKLAKEAQERAEYAAKLARQAQVSADNAKAAADATQAKHFG